MLTEFFHLTRRLLLNILRDGAEIFLEVAMKWSGKIGGWPTGVRSIMHN